LPQKKATGNQVTETAPGGLVTNAVYNAADQVTSVAEDPSGAHGGRGVNGQVVVPGGGQV